MTERGSECEDLDGFLASVERRAFVMARMATGDTEEALDLVQDAMTALVERYGDADAKSWRPLFFRILSNRIRDYYRRQAVRRRWRAFWPIGRKDEDSTALDPIESAPDVHGTNPEDRAVTADAFRALQEALVRLPRRQQEAFMFRAWEEMSVAETAEAMGCSTGSVKTHYHRAMNALRNQLEDAWS